MGAGREGRLEGDCISLPVLVPSVGMDLGALLWINRSAELPQYGGEHSCGSEVRTMLSPKIEGLPIILQKALACKSDIFY